MYSQVFKQCKLGGIGIEDGVGKASILHVLKENMPSCGNSEPVYGIVKAAHSVMTC